MTKTIKAHLSFHIWTPNINFGTTGQFNLMPMPDSKPRCRVSFNQGEGKAYTQCRLENIFWHTPSLISDFGNPQILESRALASLCVWVCSPSVGKTVPQSLYCPSVSVLSLETHCMKICDYSFSRKSQHHAMIHGVTFSDASFTKKKIIFNAANTDQKSVR